MVLVLKDKTNETLINLGTELSSSGATSIVYNVTDTNDFVCKLYRKKSYAKTIHKKLIHFEKNPPSEELAAIEVLGSTYHQLAWPKQVVYEDDKPVGFIMPKINFDLAVPLNKIFSVKNRKSAGFVEDIRWRILVCRNLAAIYKELHSKNYFVVDTKPANILTYKKIQGVCLLDCDNFKLAGTDFNADMMTPEYTAPESMNMSKEKLGREQDIFAISVLFFQLLNNGIHPYQGVPKTAATLDIRARIMKNAYAYGEQKSKVQGPSPVSIHHLFPKPLHDMFERIFAKNERPEASEWVQVFDELKKAEHLSKCSKINHQGFKKGCPTCEFEKIVAKGTKKSVAKTNNSKNNSTSTPQNKAKNKKTTTNYTPFIILGAIVLFLFFAFSPSENDGNIQTTAPIEKVKINKVESCSTDPKSCSRADLCSKATLGSKWDTRPLWIEYALEAQNRGLTCGITNKEVKVKNCFASPKSCTGVQLCDMGTYTRNGERNWHGESDLRKKYALEAQSRGLNCGVATRVNKVETCSTNPKSCNVAELCTKATSGNKWDTRPIWMKFVYEAQSRGLTCGVTTRVNKVETCFTNPKSCSVAELCTKATSLGTWEKSSQYKTYVIEAKNRGLTCGITNKEVKVKNCFASPKSCTGVQLCDMGTYTRNGERKWHGESDLRKEYALEAQSRGLTCGVTTRVNKVETCFTNPKSCSVAELCTKATSLGTWEKSSQYKTYVIEAKNRGLTCGITNKEVKVKNCFASPKSCTGVQLCDMGTYTRNGERNWHGESDLRKEYALEAQSRGLNCGVATKVNKVETCFTNPKSCSVAELCAEATLGNEWSTGSYYKKFVTEAQNRGLTCGINLEPAKTFDITEDTALSNLVFLKSGKCEYKATSNIKDTPVVVSFFKEKNKLYYSFEVQLREKLTVKNPFVKKLLIEKSWTYPKAKFDLAKGGSPIYTGYWDISSAQYRNLFKNVRELSVVFYRKKISHKMTGVKEVINKLENCKN